MAEPEPEPIGNAAPTKGNSISTIFTAFDDDNNNNNNNNNSNNNNNNNKGEQNHNTQIKVNKRKKNIKKHQLQQLSTQRNVNVISIHNNNISTFEQQQEEVEELVPVHHQEQQKQQEGQQLEQEQQEERRLFKVEELLSAAFIEQNQDCSLLTPPPPQQQLLLSLLDKKDIDDMVLPFDLGPEGRNLDAIQSAEIVPSAPPARYSVPTPYPRGQTTIYTGVPIILNPYIDFIVVNGDDRYMIRCERNSVLERSVELAKLIHAGPNSGRKGDNHFQVLNVDKDDFELIIRYMETRFIRYRDHKHLLKLLELADRFNVPDLIIYCIRELDLNITSATVMDVFKALWFYQAITLTNQHQIVITTEKSTAAATAAAKKKAAKTLKTSSSNSTASVNGTTVNSECNSGTATNATVTATNQPIPNPNPFTTEDYGVALLHNALQLIDMHAELVLAKEEMTELRFEELETIVKRDSLQLRTEVTLFECLADWSLAECRRKNLDPTPENRRRVLGPLCLMPRYLLMTKSEFQKCCDRIDLLHPTEISLVNDWLDGKRSKNPSDQHRDLLEKFRTPRAEYAKMPVHLSDRSHPQNYPKKMRLAHEGRPTEEGCWEKVGMNCLRVFACIFD